MAEKNIVVGQCCDCGRDIERGEKLQRLRRVRVWVEPSQSALDLVAARPALAAIIQTEPGYRYRPGFRCADCLPQRVSSRTFFFRDCGGCGAVAILDRKLFRGALTRGYQNYCSDTCRELVYRDRYFGHTVAKHLTVDCEHCSEPFEQQRSDSRFCSTRCRVASHRARHRGGAVTPK